MDGINQFTAVEVDTCEYRMGKPEYEAASLEILRTLIRFEDQNAVD